MTRHTVIIGGGPAGMMAAGICASKGQPVTLFEKNDRLGKKLAITGKGRCNLTNAAGVHDIMEQIPSNARFMYKSLFAFSSADCMAFFESAGVPLKIERGNRVFPVSDKASDIVGALKYYLMDNGVSVRLNEAIESIVTDGGKVSAVKPENGPPVLCGGAIVATGGCSYPGTGSTGDGYKFAKEAGHTVTKLYPSLVPLIAVESWAPELQGLSLKNVALKVIIDGKTIYKDFGEMLFTHFGISGPIVLSASRSLLGAYGKRPVISIDLKPALTEKELDNRILRDFQAYKNKDFINALNDLLPQKLIPVFVKLSEIPPAKKVNEITKEERKSIVHLLKNLNITVKGDKGFKESLVTAGGVSVSEINPSTMESKLVSGLYFTGEALDVDGYTGGFNLQIAFSTGYLAGISAYKKG